ncbi:tyrosine-type recombinase/integrase [Actinomadura sp. BRA 177]|uniref:tyrosine-type recombinase/integrase n=1 Tax=Actinomadura sp. BRA 177 TaxID=2745202 RepID=UPI0015955CAA|nr:tyrosine-type recombinase/integrase [Actinomadura sp. BRA 177]NVI91009.1 tyrosine-type recombinase/integrase [Actinomadura sp. BRA 177]
MIFTGKRGDVLRRANSRRAIKWGAAVAKLGVPNLHFHDLRHTGNTFAAESGATLRDLMERMGHDSVRAAMIYQHRTAGGNRAIAQAMDNKINNANPDDDDGAAGRLALVG